MDYSLVKAFAEIPQGGKLEVPDTRFIMRHPTKDDDQYRVMGTVSDKYVLVTPPMVANEFDSKCGEKCDTLGFLRQGAVMFLTVELPPTLVGGDRRDRVNNYLIVKSPMTGNEALEIRVSPVRVVCENTLRLSDAMATERYGIPHVANAVEIMGHYFGKIMGVAEDKLGAISRVFNLMAETSIDKPTVEHLTHSLYPEPVAPVRDELTLQNKWENMQKRYEGAVRSQMRRVHAVTELWDGKVTGGDMASMDGTLWRWYNSVTELENYSWYSKPAGRAVSVLEGARGARMTTALELATQHLQTIGAMD